VAATERARLRAREIDRRRLEYLLEDLAELMDPDFGGETNPDAIAKRLGYAKKTSLGRKLHRWGHHELARLFDAKYDPVYARQYRERNAERVRAQNQADNARRRYGKAA
jgi:hypothetical protein